MKGFKHPKRKTALITGAASGLGFELSLLIAKDAYNLVLIDINAEKLLEAKEYIKKKYPVEILTLPNDLSKPDAAQAIFNDVKDIPIAVLVNNAGFGLFGTFSNTDWQRESEMLYLHTFTTTHLTKLVLKGMLQRNEGMILNVSSLAAFQPGPLMAIYYATKAYILSFSEALANELKGTGVSLTVLCPGQTKTAFQKKVSSAAIDAKADFNMACPKRVAKYGYEAMKKGNTVAIPGRFNKFLSVLPRFVPRNMATAIVRKIQEVNRCSI
jgi:short-subunit dehydrogenase